MTLHIALIEPKIPPNTGNIARLCVATDTPLHLIEPLGFSLDDREVRRAGLDYWDRVDLWTHPNWFRFRDAISRDRCLYFSANAEQDYTGAPFRPNSVLVFGNETDGMPAKILEKHPELCYRIPMQGQMRSLNLANAVSVVLYEGLRQLGLKAPPRVTFADVPVVTADEEDEEEDEVNGNVWVPPNVSGASQRFPSGPSRPSHPGPSAAAGDVAADAVVLAAAPSRPSARHSGATLNNSGAAGVFRLLMNEYLRTPRPSGDRLRQDGAVNLLSIRPHVQQDHRRGRRQRRRDRRPAGGGEAARPYRRHGRCRRRRAAGEGA